jgi:uncharacterized protein
MDYIYLHGFASGPASTKARALSQRFQAIGLPLTVPDLNQPDFYHLTLTRQIQQVTALLPEQAPVTLIGSSFGGLTAAWLAERCPQVERVVLLAPAFQFLNHWLPRLGQAQLDRWQTTQVLRVYHYAAQRQLPLSYKFVADMARYDQSQLQRPVPTLIVHGQQDEVIPIEASRDYSHDRPWVQRLELDSDHALTAVEPEIWQAIQAFCPFEVQINVS